MANRKEPLMSPSSFQRLLASVCATGVVALAAASLPAAAQTVPLPSFNVDINQTSVSGLSSGGYMAVQFDVAFSAMLRGVGVIAGGPYYCAQGNQSTATSTCSCPFGCFIPRSTNVAQLIAITDRNAGRGRIDATGNLATHRIWLFSGTNDTLVPPRVMDDLSTYYRHYIPAERIFYKNDIAAEHAMPTDFFGNPPRPGMIRTSTTAITMPPGNCCSGSTAASMPRIPGSSGARSSISINASSSINRAITAWRRTGGSTFPRRAQTTRAASCTSPFTAVCNTRPIAILHRRGK